MSTPTIKDIAKYVGVAHSTVSRALNGDPRITAATREKVLAAAKRLGYRPNLSARALVKRRVLSIGLMIPEVTEPFYGRIVEGADQVTYTEGFNLILYLTHADPHREMAAFDQIKKGRVDGVILMIRQAKASAAFDILRAGVPVVLLLQQIPDAPIDHVRIDNILGARKAVEHLLNLGHKRIGFITGPQDALDAEERLIGYRQALEQTQLPFESALVFSGDFTPSSGERAVEQIMQFEPAMRPTAIFAANDQMAMGAIKALGERGIRIPQDMAVIGFDDIEPASYFRPALTTVRQPIEEAARTAASMLVERINQSDSDRETSSLPEQGRVAVLDTELIVRESCGFRR